MDPTFTEHLEAAREALGRDEPQEAFSSLRWVFRLPELEERPTELGLALGCFAEIARAIAGPELAEQVAAAQADLDDPEILYDLAYELIDQSLPDLAACLLARTRRLAPGNETVVTELVSALEGDGRNEEACRVLREESALCASSFLCRYLLAFNSVLAGDLPAARELAPALGAPADEDEAFMAKRITAMLRRADLAGSAGDLSDTDLRGWHFVSTGGLLLHLSPHGFEEGMCGRYAFTQDSEAHCRLGLDRLRAVLAAWGDPAQRILTLEDRDSTILALAAHEVLGLPLEPYRPDGPAGLIVAYDLGALTAETPEELLYHGPGQILFAHATCWTDPPPCAPDLTTYLYQHQQTPWGARLRVAGEGQMEEVPADDAPAATIAARLVVAKPDPEEEELPTDTLPQLEGFARAVQAAASAFHGEGRRSPLWEGSPVKSSRFL